MKLASDYTKGFRHSWNMFIRSMSYFLPYKMRVGLGIVSMAICGLATAALAYLVKPALDDIFFKQDREALFLIPLLYLLLIGVKGLFQYLQNYLMQSAGLLVLEDLRSDLYGRITRLPLKFFEENQIGMLMSRIINDVMMIRLSMPALVMSVRQVITMVALIGVVFYQDWFLASFAVLVLPLAVYPFYYFARKLRKYSRKNQSKVSDISVVLQEIFSGIRVVKAFATEEDEGSRFDRENKRLVDIAIKKIVFSELSSRIMEVVGALGMALVIWYGGSKVIDGESTPGTFFSFIAGLLMLYEPVKKLNSANTDFQQALAGAERVFEVLDSDEIVPEKDGTVPLEPPVRDIVFDRVSMTYGDDADDALSDISLAIGSGEQLAIVGPSGSGKTTLVNLLPRFYEPRSGAVSINGRDIREYTLESLRRNMGLVSQDAFLFNVTIRDNISYGMPGVKEEDVIEAAKAAYAHDFIMQLPQGYDTIIGERGVKMSGGQKQRLTIARALLKNPPLLILDEATSALDTEAERIVQKALENLMQDRTSIIIAHRLSTVLSSDRIVVMEQGRIIDMGPHEQLLTSCPLYAKLYTMQFKEEEEKRTDSNGDKE